MNLRHKDSDSLSNSRNSTSSNPRVQIWERGQAMKSLLKKVADQYVWWQWLMWLVLLVFAVLCAYGWYSNR